MLDRSAEILDALIEFPTISSDSNIDMIDHMADLLEDAGARVERHLSPGETKANLFATLGPDRDGGIILSGHSDVVPTADQAWTCDPFAMTRRDDKLYGRGTCDMKGFIAATLAMAPHFAQKVKDRPLHFSFTYDEETGCLGAQHLSEVLRQKGLKPSIAILGEPTDMQIIEGHKGCCEYTTHFNGLAGHGSMPDHGVNAAEYAVRYVSRLLALKDALRARAPKDSPFEPPWTTINVGAIQAGVAHNVIAPSAEVAWERRPVQDSDARFVKASLAQYCEEELLPQMQAVHPNASILTEVVGEVVGLLPMPENEARRIVAELTGANATGVVAFGTEAGIFQALDMDVVVCGPGSIEQAHKADEYLSLDQLSKCVTMLERLGDHLAAA